MLPARIRLQKNLNYYLRKNNISCLQLSVRSEVCYSVIYKYLRAETIEPDLICIKRIAKALNVNVSDLLKEEENV